jgi:hypothetical protein
MQIDFSTIALLERNMKIHRWTLSQTSMAYQQEMDFSDSTQASE